MPRKSGRQPRHRENKPNNRSSSRGRIPGWRSPASLDDLRKIDQITQDRLGDTKTTLDKVRKNLSSTRDDLTQQGAANQVKCV
jgi:hypothetical protein